MLVKARTKERYWGQHRTVSTGEKEDFKDVRHEGCSSMNNALDKLCDIFSLCSRMESLVIYPSYSLCFLTDLNAIKGN